MRKRGGRYGMWNLKDSTWDVEKDPIASEFIREQSHFIAI